MRTRRPLTVPNVLTVALAASLGVALAHAKPLPVENASEHWAYVPPTRPQPPQVQRTDWPVNAIDRFVLARLEAEGLSPSPPEDRGKLLRRVYLDLIGLPPSPEEVDAFLADDAPGAYERVVDKLLDSPRFGERWARPWLDLARYADSNGYQADQLRDSWAYRDWVINALNAGMPFDRFTIEQLAGDLLPDATLEQKIATGFHRTVTCNVEAGVDPEANRVNQVFDRVNTTGTVWLGTSFECAQCHDHKYDPITQKDYYQLFAYFNNTPIEVKSTDNRMVSYDFYGPKMELSLTAEQKAQRDRLQKQIKAAQAERDRHRADLLAKMAAWEKQALAQSDEGPKWHALDLVSFESSGGASHQVLEDGSILVGGERPDKDVYTVTLRTNVANITGFKLQTLTHDSLPGKGPGRHHPERPNFVCYEMKVSIEAGGDSKPAPVKLRDAVADFSQNNWDVSGLIDGKNDTGWAINPQFHKPHEASVLTDKPLNPDGETVALTFTFDQHYGGCRTIGRLRLSAMTGQRDDATVPANIAKLIRKPADERTGKESNQLEDYYLGLDERLTKLDKQVEEAKKNVNTIDPPSTLVMIEMDEPRQSHMFTRGNWQDPAQEVDPATPAAFGPTPEGLPATRLGLAKWLVSEDNPLTARVTVNRWWAELFGHGIVATEEDFGTQGTEPTHPGLLDWLAAEFMENGWRMKPLLKQIVMSATYRQDSRISPEQLARDPQNMHYARGPRVRLSAETIRDNALAISGLLSTEMGGPPVYPPQPDRIWRHVGRNAPKYDTSTGPDRFRRGVYVVWRRSAPYPSFVNFDAPDRASCVVQRSRTNTPLQALTLLNDPAYVEMAMGLAARLMTDPADGAGVRDRVAFGFRLATGREPDEAEAEHLATVFAEERSRFERDPGAAKSLINDVKGFDLPAGLDQRDLAAWFYVSNVLLNLDETITKD